MPSRIKGTPDVCFEYGQNAVADPELSFGRRRRMTAMRDRGH
jgi:hypothetical protein